MRNFSIGLGALLIVLTLGACTHPEKDQKEKSDDTLIQKEDQQMMVNKEEEEGGMFSGSLSDLVRLGASQKCTWSENGRQMGVAYVDGERVRSDAEGVILNEDSAGSVMSMINDGQWIYTWDSATKKGMKIKNEEMKDDDVVATDPRELDEKVLTENASERYGDMEAAYEYQCEKWRVDESMFTPPVDVVFEDMNALLEQVKNVVPNMENMCDLAPADEKTGCLEAMSEIQGSIPSMQ